MARLARLAAAALLATAIVAAFTTAHAQQPESELPQHHCIHDELQQRVLKSVAEHSAKTNAIVSPVGLPYVTPAEEVDLALAGSSAPSATRASTWGTMRILVSSDDLTTAGYHCSEVGEVVNNKEDEYVTCTADDVLTADKRDILINYLIPEALTLHKERLLVRQVQNSWKVTGMSGEICGEFVVPDTHTQYGVNDTDFVVYVTSVPSEAGVVAWATTCQVFDSDQPAVGVINIPAANIVSRYDQYMIRTVTHELAHSLGFSGTFFRSQGIMTQVTGIRGKDYAAPVFNGTMTVNKTRIQYGCDNASFMEIEDQGGQGSAGSHLKMRNAQDELMAPATGAGYYTALTMAVFQDLGFYRADFSKAETMNWGHNAGCDFLEEKCMEDNVTKWPDMFRSEDEMGLRCAPNRLYLGRNIVTNYTQDFPDYFQYFTVATVGGSRHFMDYCPYVRPLSIGRCNQNATAADARVQSFNVFSDSSRCIDGSFTPKPANSTVPFYAGLCANVSCNTGKGTYKVRVYGASSYVTCTPGNTLPLDRLSNAFERGGYITCPPYAEVCQANIRGQLDYAAGQGRDATVGVRSPVAAVVAILAFVLAALGM